MTETEKKAEPSTGGDAATEGPKPDAEHQRKINVANLPSDVTEQQMRDLFSGHEVEKVEIYHYRKYTLALVLFKDKDTAAAALAEKENAMFRDRRLRMHMEFTTIRHIKREVVVTVVEDENMTEEQLWDKVKAAGVEPTSVLIFYPLGYITLEKECDKPALMEKLKTAGFNVHDINQRDQNQHLDIWRAAKLFFRNRNRVQLLNIPTKWIEDKEEMKKQCAEGGTITEAVSNNVTQNPQVASNYARIFYETEEQAVKAAKALNGRVVDGKRIHALHLGSALMPDYKTSVYVTSLDKGVTEEQVYDHFKQFGEIEFTNRRNCGDAAIICYKDAASVEKALACTTFPAPTEENKDATKEVTVKKYDGPLVLRPVALKRKLPAGEEEKDKAEKTKEAQAVLGKLKAYHPVFVGNVPMKCPPLELKHYFAQHGPIKFMFSPQILTYRNSAPHPVKTFIIYYINRPSQQSAVRFFDHKFFGGHRLHVIPLRGTQNLDGKKTIKMTKIPFMSEDALFKKIKPFVGKINRIVKKSRLAAYIELEDPADVEKMLNVETPDHPLPKGKMELVGKTAVSARLYNEDDARVLNGIAKIVAKNPDMLKKTIPPPHKRQRFDQGFDQGPGGFNPNNNMNNPNAIQDLLRLAFMSGKNVGESLASTQNSFGSDPPIGNSFGDGGFGNRNRNNQGGNQGNFRGQGRMNMNQNQNRGNNANNFGGNNNAGGNNFQGSPGNQNRGGQNMNRGNNQQNQNRGGGNMNQGNMNQGGGNVNRQQQNKPMNNMNTGNQNRNNPVGGGNMNRNQNQNRNNSDNDNSFGGGNNFGNNRNNNFSNDSFGNNDNFGNNSGNFSNDNFGGNTNRGNNFGGNKRNQNDNFNNSFGGGNNSGNNSGGNNRFNNDGNNFNSNFNNRNQNNRFDNDDNNFSGNNNKGGNFGNRQNKPFNQGGGNQGGGMSFGEFNNSNNSNRSGNFGGNNSGGFGSGGGFNSGNAGGNKWNNNSQQSNTGSRLAGSIFSRRF